MMGTMSKTKKAGRTRTITSKECRTKEGHGTVLKIMNGRPTDEMLSADKAFGDLE